MTPEILVSTIGEKLDAYISALQKTWLLSYEISPDEKSISINSVKQLIEKISLSGGKNEKQLFLIRQGHLMTLPAQNCLLKTLEETRPNQLLIIITHLPHILLPTITSRCLVVNIGHNNSLTESKVSGPNLRDWSNSPARIINLTDQIAANEPAAYFLNCLRTIHHLSLKQNNSNRIFIQKALLVCLDDLNKNINPKLAIDHFFFTIRPLLSST